MSLITFRSTQLQDFGANVNASNIRNNFREGIKLVPGNTMELVSMSITREVNITIETNYNDTLIWRLGDEECYSQHVVRIPSGYYTPTALATAIELAMNASVLIGVYAGQWTCVYTPPATPADKGVFALDYGELTAPTINFNGSTLTSRLPAIAGTPASLLTPRLTPNFDYSITIDPYATDLDSVARGYEYTWNGDKSVFSDGGEVSVIVNPVQNLDTIGFVAEGANGVQLTNYAGGGIDVNTTWITPGGLANNWVFKIDSAGWGGISIYGIQVYNGVVGLASTDAGGDANLPASWDIGKYVWDMTLNVFVKDNDATQIIQRSSILGNEFVPSFTNIAYPDVAIGLAESKLITGFTEYVGNENAQLVSTQATNVQFSLTCGGGPELVDATTFYTYAYGMDDNQGTAYPLPGWRSSETLFLSKSWNDWNTLPGAPAVWTASFTFPNDSIKLKVKLVGIRTIQLLISHDTAGNGNFTEEVMLAESLSAVGNYTLNRIREDQYPLHPYIFASAGNHVSGAQYYMGGITDATAIVQEGLTLVSNPTYPTDNTLFDLPATAPPLLEAMFKFGKLGPEDIDDPPDANQVTPYDAQLNIANIWNALGFSRCNTFANGSATNEVTSNFDALYVGLNLQNPAIFVEILDFNIKSFSGESSDTMKAIAVIPAEQFQTDSATGVLHYVSPYSMPVDLGIQFPQVCYELTARLRYGNGRLVTDIIHPTTITVKLGESEESKQQRVMDKAMAKLSLALTQKQDQQISTFGKGLPLF